MDTHQDVMDAAREYIAAFGSEPAGLDIQRLAGVRVVFELPEGSGACAKAAAAIRDAIINDPYGRRPIDPSALKLMTLEAARRAI